jgi:hypothetical protein
MVALHPNPWLVVAAAAVGTGGILLALALVLALLRGLALAARRPWG